LATLPLVTAGLSRRAARDLDVKKRAKKIILFSSCGLFQLNAHEAKKSMVFSRDKRWDVDF